MTAACSSHRSIPFVGFIALIAALTQGCGGGPSSGNVTFAPTSGTVTFGGSPLSGARIAAYPEKGPVAMGVTDDAGNFTLTTGANKGAAVGKIQVSVTMPSATSDPGAQKIDMSDPMALTRAMQTRQEENRPASQRAATGGSASNEPKSAIPTKYADPQTSGLNFEIKEGEDNVLTVELN